MTGSIMFSMIETRLDIAFATSVASWFAINPSHQYTKMVKTILQYLKGSRKQKIIYSGQEELLIHGYSDFDQVGNRKNRKSTFGFIFMLNKRPVS